MRVDVLNAFRHHWNSHSVLIRMITGSATGRAQRLSASLEFAHAPKTITRPTKALCSTPFGIMEFALEKDAAARGRDSVLNAFRHHGIRTSIQAPIVFIAACAQRLSASLEFAQRGVTIIGHRLRVLNAFRHHWNSHKGGFGIQFLLLRCSTPFGIMEFAQFPDDRHRGLFECSTPFGIMEFAPGYATFDVFKILLCSTPFGIIGIRTSRDARRHHAREGVLNAFRHHWNSHSANTWHWKFGARRAQRLSASWNSHATRRRFH